MSQFLNDFSDAALTHAVKQNLYELFGDLKRWDKTDFYTSPSLQRWWTPVPYPWYTAALSLAMPADDETATIQKTIEYFRMKGNDTFTWWLSEDVETSNWGAQLEANGLKPDRHTPGMAVSLAHLNEDFSCPDGLWISCLEDDAMIHTWSQVFVEGYGLPHDWVPLIEDMMTNIGLSLPWQCYYAAIGSKMVATAAVFYGAGVAGIQMVSTLPEWRGKGIGGAVTLESLLDARKMGCKVGILQSSDMGYKIYQRLGFKEMCKMDHYYWQE